METFDEVRNFWQKNTNGVTTQPALQKEDLDKVVTSRIKKEKKAIAEYFWMSFGFQVVIYAFACYLTVKYWGDTQMVELCAAGVLLYIPFTVILLQKFKAMYKPVAGNVSNIRAGVQNQRKQLGSFFNFKKRYDFVSVPVTSLVLTIILFKLYVPGGIQAHLAGWIATCIMALLIYSTAALFENRKNFVNPLRRLDLILEDLEKES